jgi:ABC-type microcin C transport system permease subunit YejE
MWLNQNQRLMKLLQKNLQNQNWRLWMKEQNQALTVDCHQSENAPAPTNDYHYIEQDGGISNLSLKEILLVGSPSSMEVEEGSITFEKNG